MEFCGYPLVSGSAQNNPVERACLVEQTDHRSTTIGYPETKKIELALFMDISMLLSQFELSVSLFQSYAIWHSWPLEWDPIAVEYDSSLASPLFSRIS